MAMVPLMNRHTRRYMPPVQEEETVASFGDARIVKTLDGRLELRGGSPEDQQAARAWGRQFLSRADGSGLARLRWL
jgi:hypothetical protein